MKARLRTHGSVATLAKGNQPLRRIAPCHGHESIAFMLFHYFRVAALVILNPLMKFARAGHRRWLALFMLLYSSLLQAQGSTLPSGDSLLSVASPIMNAGGGGANEGGSTGGNLTPDVFGIADLLSPSDSQSATFSIGCDGVACGGDSQLRVIELPGLTLTKDTRDSATCSDTDGDGICDDNDHCLGTKQGTKVLADGCGLSPGAQLILSGVAFSPGSAELSPAAHAYLDEVVALIRALDTPELIIEGHTDDQGSESANMALSLQRAEAVYHYFVKSGIASRSLAFTGFGENFPLVPNRTANGQLNANAGKINRRIELKWATDIEFAKVQITMQTREQEKRLALERAAQARQAAASRQKQQQQQVESAEQGYTEVLEFLENTGSAEAPVQQVNEPDASPSDSDDGDPGYKIELVYPDDE